MLKALEKLNFILKLIESNTGNKIRLEMIHDKVREAIKELDSCVTNMQGLKRRFDSVLKAFEFNKKVCEAQDRQLNMFQKENIRLKSKVCHTCTYWDGAYCNKIGIKIDIGGCGDYWEPKQ